jgi:hypothetical protein
LRLHRRVAGISLRIRVAVPLVQGGL